MSNVQTQSFSLESCLTTLFESSECREAVIRVLYLVGSLTHVQLHLLKQVDAFSTAGIPLPVRFSHMYFVVWTRNGCPRYTF